MESGCQHAQQAAFVVSETNAGGRLSQTPARPAAPKERATQGSVPLPSRYGKSDLKMILSGSYCDKYIRN